MYKDANKNMSVSVGKESIKKKNFKIMDWEDEKNKGWNSIAYKKFKEP